MVLRSILLGYVQNCKANKDKIQSVFLSEIRFRNPLDGGQGDLTRVRKWPMNLERFSYIKFRKVVDLWQLNFYLPWIFLKKIVSSPRWNVMEEIKQVLKVRLKSIEGNVYKVYYVSLTYVFKPLQNYSICCYTHTISMVLEWQ